MGDLAAGQPRQQRPHRRSARWCPGPRRGAGGAGWSGRGSRAAPVAPPPAPPPPPHAPRSAAARQSRSAGSSGPARLARGRAARAGRAAARRRRAASARAEATHTLPIRLHDAASTPSREVPLISPMVAHRAFSTCVLAPHGRAAPSRRKARRAQHAKDNFLERGPRPRLHPPDHRRGGAGEAQAARGCCPAISASTPPPTACMSAAWCKSCCSA